MIEKVTMEDMAVDYMDYAPEAAADKINEGEEAPMENKRIFITPSEANANKKKRSSRRRKKSIRKDIAKRKEGHILKSYHSYRVDYSNFYTEKSNIALHRDRKSLLSANQRLKDYENNMDEIQDDVLYDQPNENEMDQEIVMAKRMTGVVLSALAADGVSNERLNVLSEILPYILWDKKISWFAYHE